MNSSEYKELMDKVTDTIYWELMNWPRTQQETFAENLILWLKDMWLSD